MLAVCACPLSGFAESGTYSNNSTNQIDIRARILLESHYVTEGRDNLDSDSIQTTRLLASQGPFSLLVWNGWGYDSGYDELNIVPSLNYSAENLDVYLNYNRKEFFESGESDNEIGAGFAWNGLPYDLALALDWYHSFDAAGSFIELSAGVDGIYRNRLHLSGRAVLGINANYIPDGHDGANHVSLELDASYPLTGTLTAAGILRYNIAIDSDPVKFPGDALLDDLFWVGAGISFLF